MRPRAHLPPVRFSPRGAFEFLRRAIRRLIEFEFIDRSIVIASQAFSAGIPLLIVIGSIGPRRDGRNAAGHIINRFELHGSSADTVRTLFSPPPSVSSTLTWVGILTLLFAVSSFTRTVQRVYERAWQLERAGVRGAWRGLVWLLGLVAYITVIALIKGSVTEGGDRLLRALIALIPGYAFWAWTPRILLGNRVDPKRFVPLAMLSTIGMALVALATPIYMPHLVETNAEKFGFIGVAFALLSWLIGVAAVAVICVVVGHQIDSELRGELTDMRQSAGDLQRI
jgi:membrane protein